MVEYKRSAASCSEKELSIKSGYLFKKGGLMNTWKKRYVVLEGSLLHVFKTKKESIPRSTIYLQNCLIQPTNVDKKEASHFTFIISHANSTKKYCLSSDSEQDLSDWINVLRTAAASSPVSKPRRSSQLEVQEKETNLPTISSKESIDEALQQFLEHSDDSAPGWKIHSQKEGVTAYLHASDLVPAVKGSGRINHPAEDIFHLILDITKKKSYDPLLSNGKRIRMLQENLAVDYLSYKPVWPTSGRDFVNLVHWRILDNGTYVIIARSTTDDECPSNEPTIVRGNLINSGWKIVPSKDKSWSEVTFMAKIDLKLTLPAPAINRVTVQQAYMISNIRELMDDMKIKGISTKGLPPTFQNSSSTSTSSASASASASASSSASSSLKTKSNASSDYGNPIFPQEYSSRLEKAKEDLLREIEDQEQWNVHSEKNGVKVFTKSDGELQSTKGVGVIDIHPREIFELIINPSKRSLYDGNLATGKTIKRFDKQTSIDYLEYKAIWPTAGRDFLNLVHWRVEESGNILIIAQGIEADECPKKDPKVVRGHVHIAGWLIAPNSTYTGATVTTVAKTDLKGSLPAFVIAKVVAEQPYIIASIRQVLKKSSRGKLSLKRVTNAQTTSGQQQPEVEPQICNEPEEKPTNFDIMERSSSSSSGFPPAALIFVFLPVFLASFNLVYSFIGALVVALAFLRLHLGPSTMSGRRKMMIATWSAPSSGPVYGSMTVDVTKTESYIAQKRIETNEKITITHIIIKALGIALHETPSINGHLVFGNYYPAETADIGCLVAIENGKDLANAKICSANEKSVEDIAKELRDRSGKLRGGKDADFEKSKGIVELLPTFLLRPMIQCVGWLGCAVGVEIPALGVRRYPFGSAMVTSVGMLGLDHAYAPHTPFAHVPLIVLIGRIGEKPMVVNSTVVAKRCVTLTVTLDHRFADGSQASRLASRFHDLVENPVLME